MAQKIRFVGIDIGKFDFFVFCSITGQVLTYENTESGHGKLIKWLGNPADTIIALEPTGGYEWALWQALDETGFDARQVSAAHVRAFARASGALVKTDPIDARLIAEFIIFRPDAGRRVPIERLSPSKYPGPLPNGQSWINCWLHLPTVTFLRFGDWTA